MTYAVWFRFGSNRVDVPESAAKEDQTNWALFSLRTRGDVH